MLLSHSVCLHCTWNSELRQPPDKMVAQFPGPYETAQGVTHTTGEIFGSGAYVLQIAAAGAAAQVKSTARTRPGLDLSHSQHAPSATNVAGGCIQTSVPTVAVSNTSMHHRLNYTLSVRVWPPQAARPLGVGCGWSAEDTLGAAFSLPVMELLELSKPRTPSGETTSTTASTTQAPGPVTSPITPQASTVAPHRNRGGAGAAAGANMIAGGAEHLSQRGPTRTQSSFHPDGGVYLSAPLLMMPPSSLAGRDTGFYLRLHVKLEGA